MQSHRTTLTQQFPAIRTQAMTRHTTKRGARARIHNNLYCGPPVQPCRANPTCDRHICNDDNFIASGGAGCGVLWLLADWLARPVVFCSGLYDVLGQTGGYEWWQSWFLWRGWQPTRILSLWWPKGLRGVVCSEWRWWRRGILRPVPTDVAGGFFPTKNAFELNTNTVVTFSYNGVNDPATEGQLSPGYRGVPIRQVLVTLHHLSLW